MGGIRIDRGSKIHAESVTGDRRSVCGAPIIPDWSYPDWVTECKRCARINAKHAAVAEAIDAERQAISAELATELAQEEWNQDHVNQHADQLIALDALKARMAEVTAAPMTAESLLNRLINFCASGSRFPSVGDVLAEAAVIVHGYGHEQAVEWAAEALQDAFANRA